jgi:alkyl sulfatase BDS1-like metallo-beta-lactamase superfamily hydrolase
MRSQLLSIGLCAALLAIVAPAFAQTQPKPATDTTKQANAAVLTRLNFADKQDFEDAQRGFIATLPAMEIKNADGHLIWTLKEYAFLNQEQAPDTVNPSLWHQARLNMHDGLFQVVDRVYQVRGFDLSNMTIIEGDTGVILIDPLVSPETAKAGLDLYFQHRPKTPVVAVIYIDAEIKAGRANVGGDASQVPSLFGMLDAFDLMFPIMEPALHNKPSFGEACCASAKLFVQSS